MHGTKNPYTVHRLATRFRREACQLEHILADIQFEWLQTHFSTELPNSAQFRNIIVQLKASIIELNFVADQLGEDNQ